MSIEGVDYSWSRPDMACLFNNGQRFACRYLSYDLTGKNLTKSEATALHNAGLAVVSNWENDAGDAKLGYNKGVEYAKEANRQHAECGGPPEAPIYFSVDWDASTSECSGPVADYFRGVASVLGIGRVGGYGSFSVIDYLLDHGLITYAWQTYAWSDGQWSNRAHIQQYDNNNEMCGGTVDYNRAMFVDYGQWGAQAATKQYGGSMFLYTVEGDPNVWRSDAGKRRVFSGPDAGGINTYRSYRPLTDAGVPMAAYTTADIQAMGLSVDEALDYIGGPLAGSESGGGGQGHEHTHTHEHEGGDVEHEHGGRHERGHRG
jgi:hypothetical protein